MSVNAKMTAIADNIRTLLDLTGKMGLSDMENNTGSVVSEVDSQATLIQQIKAGLEGKTGGGGLSVKTGTATNGTIATGLSSIEQFFIYKESISATGLIHLHYSKDGGTSFLYASAWSSSTKTVKNGTTAATVNGGSITMPSNTATSGGLSSSTTYKWVAVGTE